MTTRQRVRDAYRAARDLAAAVDELDGSVARGTDLSQLADEVARISRGLAKLAGRTSRRVGASRDQALDLTYDPRQVTGRAADIPSRHQRG